MKNGVDLEPVIPQAPDNEWPEAWYMIEEIPEDGDQCFPNRLEPNLPVSVDEMKELGICFWKVDPEGYEYPGLAVPWDPKDSKDPKLSALRDARGYSYADIITVHPDHLPNFEEKIKSFFEEVRKYSLVF
jgi:1,2-dihydroxy-3-keto-5-methylthiopentene dioxygenase